MADVFLSYKAEDRPRIAALAAALAEDGFSVWWDAHIGGGEMWRQTIERELDAAKCVIVVWSKRSTGPEGHFVRDEASRAQRRGVYLPVRIDRVDTPLGFGEIQALSLVGWKGRREDERYQAVLASVRATLAGRSISSVAPMPDELFNVPRRSVLAGAAIAGVAAAGGLWFLVRPGRVEAANSIAVLPFANLSGNPAESYFSDGIAEELRTALSHIDGLKVVGRTSSEAVRNEDAAAAAKRLGVANILTGSVRRAPGLLRVSSQLVDGSDGIERWSQSYDRPEGNALQIQSDIAQKVAEALSVTLSRGSGKALTIGGTDVDAAQDLYLKAVALTRTDDRKETLQKAIALLDAAIALDGRYADAIAAKARFLVMLTNAYASTPQAQAAGYAQAAATARQAIQLEPQLALGYMALGGALSGRLDIAGAAAQFERACALAPGDPAPLRTSADNLSQWGKAREAVSLADRAIKLDPLDPGCFVVKSVALFYARRYPDSISTADQALSMAPNRSQAAATAATCYSLMNQPDRAPAYLAKIPADDLFRQTVEAVVAARKGDRAGSTQILERIRRSWGDAANYQYAQVLSQQRDTDAAFVALDRAFALLDPGLAALPADPLLDPLRGDARFTALAKKLNVPA